MGAAQPAGRLQTGAEPLVARVAVDVPALDREFDYLVPDKLVAGVRVGSIVRVPLHGRRVRGWVTDVGVEPQAELRLQPIAKVTGWGPPPELVDLARWAAWRWAGRRTTFLRAASPERAVHSVIAAPGTAATGVVNAVALEALKQPRSVLRLAPGADRFGAVEAALTMSPTLILVPSHADAANLARRVRRTGRPVALMPDGWARAAGGATVIGTRAAAWAPMPELGSVLILDAHDDAYVEERAPTWNAWVVGAERARRAGVPCLVVSPVPTLDLLEWGSVVVPSRAEERDGWPPLHVLDRREDDPRSGLYSPKLVPFLRSAGRVLCVVNRKGRASLLACAACGALTTCEACDGPMASAEPGLICRRCAALRAAVCAQCGASRLKNLRVGVTRIREELEALTGLSVGEVTADTDSVPDDPIIVGTEAVLHRIPNAEAVAFLDFDQELLAPRFTASESALGLLARAARAVGGRRRGGHLILQTRLPQHEVIAAALHADPELVSGPDGDRRRDLGLPPYRALAVVSGDSAAEFVHHVEDLEVRGPVDGVWQLRADNHDQLCDALAAAPRPAGRLRIEVDPRRA